MPLVVTVQPSDACGRPLPVLCRVRITRNDRLDAAGVCEPNDPHVALTVPVPDAVYAVFLSAGSFADSSVFVPVAQQDTTARILCLASAKHATPVLPSYLELPGELQRVLERSPTLDVSAGRELPDTTLSSRSLHSRSTGTDRDLPERSERLVRDGERRWQRLHRELQAGLLNLFAKMRSFTMADGRDAWSYVVELRAVARDRILAVVDPALKAATEQSSLFHDARALLPIFHKPPAHFSRDGSWKSNEPFGNLQFSFFASHEDHKEIWVDADVDDAAGIGHVEQVLRNESRNLFRAIFRFIPGLPKGTTHPYDIHQILVFYQKANATAGISDYRPHYRLRVAGTPSGYTIPPP